MEPILAAIVLASIAVVAGLVVTWYHADDEPVFAPRTDERVLFKTVLRNFWSDFVSMSGLGVAARSSATVAQRVWTYWAPRLTDRTILMAVFTDLSLFASGENVWVWLATHREIAFVVVAVNLFAASPRNAPERLTR